ncbi:MAG: SDR family oxidoreductase [Wenzhouxiangellaceae bacterium]
MKVLVIGGTGLIGSHIVDELLARGHQVSVLSRNPDRYPHHDQITYIKGDSTKGIPSSVFDGFDGLVYAAGSDYRELPKGCAWKYFYDRNVVDTANVFANAAEAGVKRGAFISSFYHAIRPDYTSHPYISSRRDSEAAVIDAVNNRMNVSIIQPAWVLGTTTGHLNLGEFMFKWSESIWPIIINKGGTNWVSAESLAHATVTALERGEHGERYCIGDENRSWQEVTQRLTDKIDRCKKVWVAPRINMIISGYLASGIVRLLGRRSGLIWHRWVKSLMEDAYFDPTPAVEKLGYPVNQVDAAIDKMAADWMNRSSEKSSSSS